jgi:hypothetical protein
MSRYSIMAQTLLNGIPFNALSDDAQLVFFRLWVHPRLTVLGTLQGSLEDHAQEMRWRLERFTLALDELIWLRIVCSEETVLLLGLPHFLKQNIPYSTYKQNAWKRAWDDLPACAFKQAVRIEAKTWGIIDL